MNYKYILGVAITTISLMTIATPVNKVYAANFDNSSYSNAREFKEVHSRILIESNKQALELYNILAKWETKNIQEQEMYDDISLYIENAKKNYSFLNDYTESSSKELKRGFDLYISGLENNKGNIDSFINGKTILMDYLETAMPTRETIINHSLFYKNGLLKLNNQFLYNNDVRIALSKLNSSKEEDKNEGKEIIYRLISLLEEYKNSSGVQEVMKNYANAYQNHYRKMINGDNSMTKELIIADRYRIESLFIAAQEVDEGTEYYDYVQTFASFVSINTESGLLSQSEENISKTLKNILDINAKSDAVKELKKSHYELYKNLILYNEKKITRDELLVFYKTFSDVYKYNDSYYSKVMQRFNGFNSGILNNEIKNYKDKCEFIDLNNSDYTSLAYNFTYTPDSYEYETLSSKGNKKIYIISLGITALLIGTGIIVYRNKKRGSYRAYDEDSEYYDDSYTYNSCNYNDYYDNGNYNNQDYNDWQ